MTSNKIKKYKVEKIPGCSYRVSFYTGNKKTLMSMTASPRTWLLFAKDLRNIIRETRLKPIKRPVR